MAELASRQSALDGHIPSEHIGEPGQAGVSFDVVRELQLWQVACWPDTAVAVGVALSDKVGIDRAPGPGQAKVSNGVAVLRVEPLKCWVLGGSAPALSDDMGAVVDLSHARTHIRVSGPRAAELLMRHLPVNLNESAFALGSVASSAIHHVGVTVWRSELGYELFVPRGFALSVWQMLLESAAQFGATARAV